MGKQLVDLKLPIIMIKKVKLERSPVLLSANLKLKDECQTALLEKFYAARFIMMEINLK